MAAALFPGGSSTYLDEAFTSPAPAPMKVSWLRRRWVQGAVPLATSFLLHAVLVVAGLLLIEPIQQVYQVMTEQVVIPSMELGAITPQPLTMPGAGDDPFNPPRQDQVIDAPADAAGWGTVRTRAMNEALAGGGGGADEAAATLALGPKAARPGRGTGTGTGDGSGTGAGPGLAPFGPATRGGPGVDFIVKGNAHRIVFVCDASGSMGSKFDVLKDQLRDSIKRLSPTQGFDIIFFNNNRAYAMDGNTLVMANPAGKQRAYRFLETIVPGPDSNPLPALQTAFRLKPELVYLLTDGEFEFAIDANAQVTTLLGELNRDGRVKINTIAFVGQDEAGRLSGATTGFVALLQQIARTHGGAFKLAVAEAY